MHRALLIGAVVLLAACGGGGGGAASPAPAPPPPPPPQPAWIVDSFLPAASFADQCTVPRGGVDPVTGAPYPDRQGSTLTENLWLRSWTHELYLWYHEIVDAAADPTLYSPPDYFARLKTSAKTPSGSDKDRFHFALPTAEWRAQSQSGITAGYGAQFVVLSSTPPRQVVVAYPEPGSPAAAAGLRRGTEVLSVDGVDLVHANDAAAVAALNGGLWPGGTGETHVLTVRDRSGVTTDVTLQSAIVQATPVQNAQAIATPIGLVGYLLFNDHIATAEEQLTDAIRQLELANVTDLVLDLRYNGGGYLVLASELAYMIAGGAQTAGRTFERLRFNDKHPATNPVTGAPLAPLPFQSTTVGLSSAPAGEPLPTLDLPRVFVLTGSGTCSASESIINALRGIDVEVIQIGSATCGKPYGFYPADNCGTTYFSIQFAGENEKGFGDYGDGFAPIDAPGPHGERIPGCAAADDFSHDLGDPLERRLAAALAYRESGSCPAPSGLGAPNGMTKPGAAGLLDTPDGELHRSPWRENRILWLP